MQYFKLKFENKTPQKLGRFLLRNGFSKRALTNSQHNGGMILVNHHRRYTSYLLHSGDEVIFILGEEKKNQWLKPSTNQLNIVLEQHDYLVINKEAGVLSIPSRYEDNDAVVNRLLYYFQKNGQKDLKPHVITRLDRDTSGLVLVGKNAVAHARFSEMGKDCFIKKYHAIVHGNFSKEQEIGIIDAPIGKLDTSVKRGIVANGQRSITKYRVLDQVNGASLVELQLLTGRTHQIRVHMQYLDHPLFGDPLYGIKDNFKRQALNCFYLKFDDPFSERKQEVTISEPLDMKCLWQRLISNKL
ncbi:RluA family pseudouridine synthase [Lactobacillus paragasseri]|uniref:RNA pseudouridylate synthase n=1 Tax=Lactobacillus paragasseri TaxID=2107999 RepID=A0ABD5A370_9LACO|nr:RluA family pseudouridine synthase [Lactobacillus paragasseri]MDO6361949.1 RluA family pseudouridine synthase [Lactobacillus paragasseri]